MAPTSSINKHQLIQRITKTISQCFEGPHIEDSVQLQIVKVNIKNFKKKLNQLIVINPFYQVFANNFNITLY